MIRWISKPHGVCPVQADGWFMGYYFYFRSRWDKATIEFYKREIDWESDINGCVLKYTLITFDEAGWLPKWMCRLLIWKGCFKFILKRITTK